MRAPVRHAAASCVGARQLRSFSSYGASCPIPLLSRDPAWLTAFVFGRTADRLGRDDNGAWAEYMLVPASYAARAPATLDLTRAGAVPIAGLTAHETITDILAVREGEEVLITAAAGGVGHLAVQLARQLGARVVATAGESNHAFLRGLGAETVW